MNAYWTDTSEFYWGIYVGGVNRACSHGPDKSWVDQVIGQGWGLEPIWVGLQAPCVKNTTLSTMSSDTNTAYSQGETAADNAYNETVNTLGMNANSLPIVYDMEAFDPSNSSCLAAVKAFMRGWDTVLDAGTAQFPGYYGSVGASDPTAIYSISPRPSPGLS